MRPIGVTRLGIATCAFVLLMFAGGGSALNAQGTSTMVSSWTVYHGNPQGTGVAPSVSSVILSPRAWASPTLDGQIYGEPLAFDGLVFVASENDTVYALSAASGAVVWSAHLGPPVPASALPCGDISPTVGITGTPVVDTARSEVFVVADELVGQHPAHELVGLDAMTGKVELTQNVDPPGSTPPALLQRTGLALDAGRVVFGFGGNFGDCSTYHGWVVSVPEVGGTAEDYAVDSGAGQSQGAIWMGGAAPVVDSSGNIWVEAGNGSATSPGASYDHSDSVLELSPALALLQYFAPSSWAAENARDLDLSTAPALLEDGEVVAAGKDGGAYLLDGAHLGGIGGEQLSMPRACSQEIGGGAAIVGTTVYLPCLSGPVAVQVSSNPAGVRLLWRATSGGGPPIVAAGLVWSIGQNGTLYGISATTGAVVEQASIGAPANHFPTPSVGSGVLLAAGANDIVAFHVATNSAAAGTTTSSAAATSTTATGARSKPPVSTGGLPAGAIVAIALGGLAVAAGAAWFWRRARRRGVAP
ncbi:MAG TPA: PQQ-binding-like beta-propeller repeat protein [Acidimicrobiales bacterium]|nr:PQQ-binding-like beta-propeller repeat protein [Acidimicrobiales bacterium]